MYVFHCAVALAAGAANRAAEDDTVCFRGEKDRAAVLRDPAEGSGGEVLQQHRPATGQSHL